MSERIAIPLKLIRDKKLPIECRGFLMALYGIEPQERTEEFCIKFFEKNCSEDECKKFLQMGLHAGYLKINSENPKQYDLVFIKEIEEIENKIKSRSSIILIEKKKKKNKLKNYK